MINRIWKKTAAIALALSLKMGILPSATAGADLLTPAVTAYAAEPDVILNSASVALDDAISLNFYAYTGNNVKYVIIKGPNEEYMFTTSFTRSAENKFAYPLYATQLNEKVTIQFFDRYDKPITFDGKDSFTYSVSDYCEKALASDITDTETKAIQSLKNLGTAADNLFKGGTAPVPFINPEDNLPSDLPMISSKVKMSLVLDSRLAIRLYLDGLTEDSETDDGLEAVEGRNGKYCFEISGLDPTQLDDIQTINYGGREYSFSVFTYCARAVMAGDQKTIDLAEAIFEYNKHITAYAQSKA